MKKKRPKRKTTSDFNQDSNREIAELIRLRLAAWLPYYWHEATTGSLYLKFPHWGLGSVRVANHQGRTRYSYAFEFRTDVARVGQPGKYGYQELDRFLADFQTRADNYGIKPGQRQTWEEHRGIQTPDWKVKKYSRGSQ